MRVVVIEDHPRMVELISRYLEESGLEVVGVRDGESGLAAIAEQNPDVVVLDLMLPGMSGTKVCTTLRSLGNDVPIIMVTARGQVSERVAGLDAGADDYLVKPFALEELLARVRAIGRRREQPISDTLVAGDVVLDLDTRRVTVAGIEIDVPRREFAVLEALMDPPGRAVSRGRLHEAVWDNEIDVRSNALEVHVSRVRHHLAASSNVTIKTLRGVGYRLDVAKPPPTPGRRA